MRFDLVQRLEAPPADVAEAFTDPALYAELATLPKLGDMAVLERTGDGDDVHLRVRYRFTGDLSAAVTAVIDPEKLSWVDDSHHDLNRRTVRFELIPDHYRDRFRASGSYRFEPAPDDPGATVRTTTGEIKVKVLLVGGQAERAIVSGLTEHQALETAVVNRWLS